MGSQAHLVVVKAVGAGVALILAVVRLAFPVSVGARVDPVVLSLIAAAFLILVLPWEQLRTLKAAGIEVVLERPQVQGAIAGLGLGRVEDDKLRARLRGLGPLIDQIVGSRVLWVDDRPENVLAQRRLFRALGVEVVSVTSSDMALRTLLADNDFDLIITDVQRNGMSYRFNDGEKIHDGVNFVVLLLQADEPAISSIPVVFYAGYPWQDLKRFTRPATDLSPEIEACRDTNTLVTKVILALAEARTTPIQVAAEKRGTRIAESQETITVEQWAWQKGFADLAAEAEEEEDEESGGEEEEPDEAW